MTNESKKITGLKPHAMKALDEFELETIFKEPVCVSSK